MKAIIIKIISQSYQIMDISTEEVFNAKPQGILRYQKSSNPNYQKISSYKTKIEPKRIKLAPKVGDIVEYSISNNKYLITKIIPRTNELMRPKVANIDKAFLVFSAKEPLFSQVLLDTFLISIYKENIIPVIIITKIDLLSSTELVKLKARLNYYYKYLGISIYYLDIKSDANFLLSEIKNNLCIFTGQTGVGKSSILNKLIPSLKLATQSISKALGRGKHTTRETSLYPLNGGYVVDSPGFSSLEYNVLYKEELKKYYPDFLLFSKDCKFNNCDHISGNCQVIREVLNNTIPKERYDNYLSFYTKIKNIKRKY